jgi:hypothetical protein
MPRKGYKQTDIHRAAISAGLRGKKRKLTPEHLAAIDAAKHGAKSPRWRGGKSYQMVCPQHPYASEAGKVLRSHIVWEFDHHQFLPRCFHLHHINHDGTDNRPENLALMFPVEHRRWHHWERRRD